MSRVFYYNIRNGKIDRYPLRVRRLVCFNRERYESVKGIAGSVGRRISKGERVKNLGAKIKKIEPALPQPLTGDYKPSNVTLYMQNGSNWRWRRVNEWFDDLKDYYSAAK